MAAATAVLVLPAAAPAEIVPPGNSAATQYTEAFPTAGGQKDTETGNKKGNGRPAQTLGSRNAQRLESQGPAGKAAAAVAAETAPSSVTERKVTTPGQTNGGGNVTGRSAGGNSGDTGVRANTPDGASGLGEVISQATGSSSSGQMGLLLPFVIVGAVLWSFAFFMRRRKRPTE